MKPSFWLNLCLLLTLSLVGCAPASAPSAATPAPSGPAQTYLASGDQAFAQKDYDQAILEYSQAIQLNPNYAEAYHHRATTYLRTNRFGSALVDYYRANRPLVSLVIALGVMLLVLAITVILSWFQQRQPPGLQKTTR